MKRDRHTGNINIAKRSGDALYWVFLSAIITITPLIVRMNGRGTTQDEFLIYSGDMRWESFSYYKGVFLVIMCGLIVLTAVSGIFVTDLFFPQKKSRSSVNRRTSVFQEIQGRLKKIFTDPIIVAACIYSLFAVLSAYFSEYRATAIIGIAERREGIFVLLSYVVVLFTAKSIIKTEKDARILFYVFVVSTLCIGIIGTLQTFEIDVFQTNFVRKIVLGELYGSYTLNAVTDKAYATLYNPNCLGLYAAFLTPVFFFAGLFADKKNPIKYICFFVCILMFICLYGSYSMAGYIGFAAAFAVALLIMAVYIAKFGMRKTKAVFFGTLIVCAVIGFIAAAANYDRLNAFLRRELNIEGEKYPPFITDLQINGNDAIISAGERSLTIRYRYADNVYEIVGQTPEQTTADGPDIRGYYNIEGFGNTELRAFNDYCYINVRGVQFFFQYLPSRGLTLLSQKLEVVDIEQKIPSFGFENMQRLATGRGYIWSKSIPLLSDNLVIGGGPDSFAYQFPQHDALGKIRVFGRLDPIVDKPHNMYLQVAINTGVISLAALLFIFGYYLVKGFRGIISGRMGDRFTFGLSVGFYAGVCAYLICSLSTDSTVSVSPVFYAGLGLALALTKLRGAAVK